MKVCGWQTDAVTSYDAWSRWNHTFHAGFDCTPWRRIYLLAKVGGDMKTGTVCVALHEWPALDFRSHAVTSPCIRQHSETSCWSGLRSMLQRHMMWWHAMASASCWSGRGSMLQRHTILVTCYDVMLIWSSSHAVIGHGLFKQNMAFLYSYIMLPNKTAQCGDEFTTDSSRFLDTETCLFKFLKTCNIKLLF